MLLVARIYLPEQLQSMVVCSSMLPMNMVPVYSHHKTFLVQSPRELSQAPYFFLESFFRMSACVASNLICSLLWLILSFSLVKLFYLYSHVREQRLHERSQDPQHENLFHSSCNTFLCAKETNKKLFPRLYRYII